MPGSTRDVRPAGVVCERRRGRRVLFLVAAALAATGLALSAAPAFSAGPTIASSQDLDNGEVDHPYSPETLDASGGVAPLTFTLASGTLPAGLTLSPGGTVSGTPTAAVDTSFIVNVTDADGSSATGVVLVDIDAPSMYIYSSTAKFKHSKTSLPLGCSAVVAYGCSGEVELAKIEHKTTTKTDTIVLASGSYNISPNEGTPSVPITLTTEGKHVLANVAKHPLHETVIVTVLGGKTQTKTVEVS
jgi:hypothetical protein